jgi:hypothetical protein
VCVLTRRFTGGLDSCESSPFATLSRGAFSAPSLVTPIRADTSRDRVVPVCNTDLSLPTPPHTASVEQPVRQGSGSGRRECAPRRTREKDHLGALGKPSGGGSLQPPLFSRRENAIAKEPGSSYPEGWPCVSWLGASLVARTPASLPRLQP